MKPKGIKDYIREINDLGGRLTHRRVNITSIIERDGKVIMEGDFSAVLIFLRGYLLALLYMEVDQNER